MASGGTMSRDHLTDGSRRSQRSMASPRGGRDRSSIQPRRGSALGRGHLCLLPPAARRFLQGVMAMTRRGLPEPPTIFSGAAMTMAPVGGS